MSNLMSRLDERVMPSKTVRICLDLNLLAERDAAMAAVASAYNQTKDDERMAGGNPHLAAARAAVDEAEARIREKSIRIRITGVDRTTYNRFMLACPPRKGRQESFDSSKFFMYVARETGEYIDEHDQAHEILAEEWNKIDKTITDGEHDRIAQAVVEVNRGAGGSDIDFLDVASATTRDSFGISASPEPTASPRAGSGDGSRKKSTSKTSTAKADVGSE